MVSKPSSAPLKSPSTAVAAAPWLTEVHVAGQLPDDEDVQAGDQLGLEAGGVGQLLVADGGAEVGKQAHVLAQAQDGLLRAQRAVELVVLPVAHGTKQHGIGFHGQFQGVLRQRVPVCVVGGTADLGLSIRKAGPGPEEPSPPLRRFRNQCRHPAALQSS
jgi:hypothetical protein